ncbi:hypothetical protein QYF36_004675 [Acer negundo]|nr:hypothetical protein QYF36_004675 [Acer negundo]
MVFVFFVLQNDKDVRVSVTCIRVPVMRAHTESVNLQFENPLDEVKHGLGTFKSSLNGGVHIVKANHVEDLTGKTFFSFYLFRECHFFEVLVQYVPRSGNVSADLLAKLGALSGLVQEAWGPWFCFSVLWVLSVGFCATMVILAAVSSFVQ